MKITIITVCYNAVGTLERTILSVLEQSYANIEYIIIDGGSVDGTVDVIKKYENKLSYWISERDNGVYDAMNKGIKVATGDFLYFLGADDVLRKNILSLISPELKGENRIYYGNVFRMQQNVVYDGTFSTFKLTQKNICHQAVFYHKNVFKENEYNLEYRILADYELNIRLWGDSKYHFEYIPYVIADYADGGVSSVIYDMPFRSRFNHIVIENLGILPYLYLKMIAIKSFLVFFLNKYRS